MSGESILKEHALHALLNGNPDRDVIAEIITLLERNSNSATPNKGSNNNNNRPLSPAQGFNEIFGQSNNAVGSLMSTSSLLDRSSSNVESTPPTSTVAAAAAAAAGKQIAKPHFLTGEHSDGVAEFVLPGRLSDSQNTTTSSNNNDNSGSILAQVAAAGVNERESFLITSPLSPSAINSEGSPSFISSRIPSNGVHSPQTSKLISEQAEVTEGGRRRVAISAVPVNMTDIEHFVPPVIEKDSEDTIEVRRQVHACNLFSSLDEDEQEVVVKAMDREEFQAGVDILKQGEPSLSNRFYVILQGTVSIIKNGKEVAKMEPGQSFGELEMMYDTQEPCAATVHAVTPMVCYFLDRQTFKNIVLRATLQKRAVYLELLGKVPFLKGMSEYDKATLADVLQRADFEPDQPIIKFAERINTMYIIYEGTVKVVGRDSGKKKDICTLSRGDPIGELEFLFNHAAVADVIAVTKVRTAKMNRKHFELCMGPIADHLKLYMTEGNKYDHYLKHANKAILGEISAAEQKLKHTKVAAGGGNVIAAGSVDSKGEIVVLDDFTNVNQHLGVGGGGGDNKNGDSSSSEIDDPNRNKFLYRFPLAAVHQQNTVIIGVREDGVILSWNAAAARLTNYSNQDTLGQSIYSLVKKADDQKELHKLLQASVQWAGNTEAMFKKLREKAKAFRRKSSTKTGGESSGVDATETTEQDREDEETMRHLLPHMKLVFSRRDGLTYSHIELTCVPGVVAQPKHIPEMLLLVGIEQKKAPPEKELDYGDWIVEQIKQVYFSVSGNDDSSETLGGGGGGRKSLGSSHSPTSKALKQLQISGNSGESSGGTSSGATTTSPSKHASFKKTSSSLNNTVNSLNNNAFDISGGALSVSTAAAGARSHQQETIFQLLREYELLKNRSQAIDKETLHAVNPRLLLGQVVSSLQHEAVEKGNTVNSEFAQNVPENLFCDTEMLPEVFRVALHHCVKHVRDGTIRIYVQIVEDRSIEYLEITFEDNGPGVDASEVRAFEKAMSGRAVPSSFASTGLFKLKAAVERIGGTMSVKSVPNHTIVKFRIQYLPSEPELDESFSAFQAVPSSAIGGVGGGVVGNTASASGEGMFSELSQGGDQSMIGPSSSSGSGSSASSSATTRTYTTLVAEEHAVSRNALCSYLWNRRHAVVPAHNAGDFMRLVESSDIIIVDPDQRFVDASTDIFALLQRLERRKAIVIAGQNVTDEVRDAHRRAGFITLSKPYSPVATIASIKRAEETVGRIKAEQEKVAAMRATFQRTNRGEWTKGVQLGKGAFGDVYEAIDVLTGGKMAVKMMKVTKNQNKQEVINEVEVMCTLRHPNIIHYFYCEDVPETGRINIFMEYAGGGTLNTKMDQLEGAPRAMTPAEMRGVLVDIVEGVKYIHSRRFVHCDMKTPNVLFGSDGRAKIGDFGTAKQLQNQNDKIYVMSGTFQYMAPECMSADAELNQGYDFSADIWSIGCIAMELATGKMPWSHLPCKGQGMPLIKYLTDLLDEEEELMNAANNKNPFQGGDDSSLNSSPINSSPINSSPINTTSPNDTNENSNKKDDEEGFFSIGKRRGGGGGGGNSNKKEDQQQKQKQKQQEEEENKAAVAALAAAENASALASRGLNSRGGIRTHATNVGSDADKLNKHGPDLSNLFDVHPAVFEFIRACLEVDPDKRPTAEALLDFPLLRGTDNDDTASALKQLQKAKLVHTLEKFVAFQDPEDESMIFKTGGGGKQGDRRKSMIDGPSFFDSDEDDLPPAGSMRDEDDDDLPIGKGGNFFDSDEDEDEDESQEQEQEKEKPFDTPRNDNDNEENKTQQEDQDQQQQQQQEAQSPKHSRTKTLDPESAIEAKAAGSVRQEDNPINKSPTLAPHVPNEPRSAVNSAPMRVHGTSTGGAHSSPLLGTGSSTTMPPPGEMNMLDDDELKKALTPTASAIATGSPRSAVRALTPSSSDVVVDAAVAAVSAYSLSSPPSGRGQADSNLNLNNNNNNNNNATSSTSTSTSSSSGGVSASSVMAVHDKLMVLLGKVSEKLHLDMDITDPLKEQYKKSLPENVEQMMESSDWSDKKAQPFVPQVSNLLSSHAHQLDAFLKKLEK